MYIVIQSDEGDYDYPVFLGASESKSVAQSFVDKLNKIKQEAHAKYSYIVNMMHDWDEINPMPEGEPQKPSFNHNFNGDMKAYQRYHENVIIPEWRQSREDWAQEHLAPYNKRKSEYRAAVENEASVISNWPLDTNLKFGYKIIHVDTI